jgi:hypothetical protein
MLITGAAPQEGGLPQTPTGAGLAARTRLHPWAAVGTYPFGGYAKNSKRPFVQRQRCSTHAAQFAGRHSARPVSMSSMESNVAGSEARHELSATVLRDCSPAQGGAGRIDTLDAAPRD